MTAIRCSKPKFSLLCASFAGLDAPSVSRFLTLHSSRLPLFGDAAWLVSRYGSGAHTTIASLRVASLQMDYGFGRTESASMRTHDQHRTERSPCQRCRQTSVRALLSSLQISRRRIQLRAPLSMPDSEPARASFAVDANVRRMPSLHRYLPRFHSVAHCFSRFA